jgi:hypothetical protein
MVPLIVTTILFSTYINQQHFRVTENRKSCFRSFHASSHICFQRYLISFTYSSES